LGTTEQVIKNYLRTAFDKLGVWSRLELALYVASHGGADWAIQRAAAMEAEMVSSTDDRRMVLARGRRRPVLGLARLRPLRRVGWVAMIRGEGLPIRISFPPGVSFPPRCTESSTQN